MRVLDVFGEPIERLYAAGELVGGFHGAGYMTGTSIGKSAIFGRVAGTAAAAEESELAVVSGCSTSPAGSPSSSAPRPEGSASGRPGPRRGHGAPWPIADVPSLAETAWACGPEPGHTRST